MNCKNCKTEVSQNDKFCRECGAKIIRERITLKSIFSYLLVALGWESNFFITLRYLFYKPQIVIEEYISGTRKKFVNPFTFFTISLAISLFVFSQNSDKFVKINTGASLQQSEIYENIDTGNTKDLESQKVFGYKNQKEFAEEMSRFQIKYYNLVSFFSLPIFSLLAFIVFGKRYNYGEHLVINTYLNGILTIIGTVLFIFTLLTGINVFGIGAIVITFLYYSYTYMKLNELTFGKLILKILKFLGILFVFFVISTIIVFIFLVIQNQN